MIKMKKKNFILLIIGVVIISMMVTLGGSLFYSRVITNKVMVDEDSYRNIATFASKYSKLYQLENTIDRNFLWNVDDGKMMEAVYKAAVESLGDKYSVYMTKEEQEQWNNYLSGSYSGVGITFTMEESGDYRIVRIMEDGPAEEAGLKVGDYLLSVDGKKFSDFEKMGIAMRGEKGTKVVIEYERDGKSSKVTMTRASVALKSVYSMELEGNLGYIGIASFDENTGKEFETELKAMEQKNVKGLVIDIRGNGGGYVEQGVAVADVLLPACTITYTKDKAGKKEYHNSDENATELPYVLLVNGSSASTAEIVAAAIKDNKGGVLVGTTTYGKGIVQGSYGFKDGSAIKLTIMEYFSPDGNTIHKKGVEPNYKVELKKDDEVDYQLEKAIELLQK
ncbi:MAG TPA: S41 family peptidase [Anaerovoracaceae bacterium]|nr:S41 family peptidase [Anaerovoracaceae bacterium]